MLLSKTLHSSTLKLAFIYVIGFSSAIFILLGYIYWCTVNYVSENSDRRVAAERAYLVQTFATSGPAGLARLIDARTRDPSFAEWAYLLAGSSRSYIAGNLREWPPALRGDRGWGIVSPVDWREQPSAPAPLRVAYEVLPQGYHLVVGRETNDFASFRTKIASAIAWTAGLFLALAAAAGISTSRRSVARIEAINATSRQIIETGLRGRIQLRGTGDEWDGLAQNLNSMLDRIEELVESNRQVSNNVAHDLRTPLTRIRGRLERAYNRELDIAQYRALIGDVIAEVDDVLRTFASLLRITQIENRDRTAGFRNLDLAEIAREVVELFDPTAEEHRATLRLGPSERVDVVGDRDLLFDAIANLIDNAIRHGGDDNEVQVGVVHSDDCATVYVADRGPGIPAVEHKHVLQRFYRLERSRNRPGNGLGLSLVAAVAHLHGARIEMRDNLPGFRIEVRFPLPAVAPPGGAAPPRERRPSAILPLAVVGVSLVGLAAPARSQPALQVESKIALPAVSGRIDHMAVDLTRKRLFVAELGNASLDVVDLVTGRQSQRITGLAGPQGAGLRPRPTLSRCPMAATDRCACTAAPH